VLSDELCPDAADAVITLLKEGLEQVIMLGVPFVRRDFPRYYVKL